MKYLRIVLGLLISGFCIWLAFRNIAWHDLFIAVQNAKWAWFIPMTLIYLCGHILRSYRWSFLLSPIKKISPIQLFPILMFGFLINNILPARAGEVARAYAGAKRTDIPTSTLLGSIAMERLTDLIGLGAVMLIALSVLPMDQLPMKKVAVLFVCGIAVVGISLLVAQRIHQKGIHSAESVIGKVLGFIDKIIQGFASLKSPVTMLIIALLSVSIWSIEAITLMIGSRAFDLNLHFAQSNALLSGISFGVMIPAAPGYIGTYEFFGGEMLKLLGYSADVALPFLLSFHFYQMLICSLLGLPILIKFGMPSKQ